jgi:hypothetical protein
MWKQMWDLVYSLVVRVIALMIAFQKRIVNYNGRATRCR